MNRKPKRIGNSKCKGKPSKLMSLFHFTCNEAAKSFVQGDDFLGCEEGLVWFAEHPQHIDGESSREALCEIYWDESLDLDQFRRPVKYESTEKDAENFDELAPQKVCFFAIPVDIANRNKQRVRHLGSDERAALMI